MPENQQGRHWGKRCLSPQTTSRPEEKPAATRNDRSEPTAKSKAPFVGYRDARYFPNNVDPYRAPTKAYAPRPYTAPRAAYAPRPHQAPMWVGAPRPVPLMDLRPRHSIRIPQPGPPAKTPRPSPNVEVPRTLFPCLYRGCGKKFVRQCVRDAHHSCHRVGETVGLGRPVSGMCQDCGEELGSQRALKDHRRLCPENPVVRPVVGHGVVTQAEGLEEGSPVGHMAEESLRIHRTVINHDAVIPAAEADAGVAAGTFGEAVIGGPLGYPRGEADVADVEFEWAESVHSESEDCMSCDGTNAEVSVRTPASRDVGVQTETPLTLSAPVQAPTVVQNTQHVHETRVINVFMRCPHCNPPPQTPNPGTNGQ